MEAGGVNNQDAKITSGNITADKGGTVTVNNNDTGLEGILQSLVDGTTTATPGQIGAVSPYAAFTPTPYAVPYDTSGTPAGGSDSIAGYPTSYWILGALAVGLLLFLFRK